MKQMMVEEDIALLEHRLTSTQSQIVETSATTCSLSNEIKRLQVLKKDIIHQAIITSRGIAENLNTMIQIEKNKFSSKNRFIESTWEWQKMVFDAIEIR
jgi:hypothetical protein